jgi:hypothetical protein
MSLHDPHAGRRAYAPSMFDDLEDIASPIPNPPAAHTADPLTSHDALAEYEASGRRDLHKMIVMGLVLRYPLKTACELFELTNARREDLVTHMWVHDGYERNGYWQMTSEQKAMYDEIVNREPL